MRVAERKAAVGVMALTGLLALSACGSSSSGGSGTPSSGSPAAGKTEVGVILPDTTSSARYTQYDAPLLTKAFQDAGIKADIQNAQGDNAKFVSIAQSMIAEGVKVLLIDPADPQTGISVESTAKAAGVQVIDYDRVNLGGSAAYYVSFDNVAVGKLQGEGLVQAIKDWNVQNPQIFELGGSPTDNNATLFEQGYDSVLQPLYDGKQATLVSRIRVPNWDNQQGATMFQQGLQANPQINAVLAANDGLGQSAISVLKNNKVGPKTVPVTGQDATLQGIQNILAGYQYMTVYKPIYEEVAGAATLAILARAGQTPDPSLLNGEVDAQNHKTPSLLLTPQSVNASNIESTVIQDKFIDPTQLCTGDFAKMCSDAGIK